MCGARRTCQPLRSANDRHRFSAADPSTNGGPQRRGFGIDVGGSGVKGGIVDLDTGQLIGERFKLETPQPATPEAVSKTVAAVVREFGWTERSASPIPAW